MQKKRVEKPQSPSKKSLDLLRVLLSIAREKNLTRASEKMGLSQPAMSHALKRLRSEWGDPLFVRSAKGLEPTDRMKEALPELNQLIDRLDRAMEQTTKDPFQQKRSFTLATTTYFELIALPTLMRAMFRDAPLLTLKTRPLIEGFPIEDLERGHVDLAIAAYFQQMPESIRVKKLGSDPHVGVVRSGHPYLKEARTLSRLLSFPHVKIDVPPGSVSRIDEALAKKNLYRSIVGHFSNFSSAAPVLAVTDSVLVCPRALAKIYQEQYSLEIFELPIAVPPVEVKMAWHERSHLNPLHAWAREQLATIAKNNYASHTEQK